MQYGGEPDAGAEMLGVSRDGDQGVGGGFEQQVVDDRLVRSRQGEDDMEIGHGQQFGLAVGQPFLGRGGLALRAMPIATGVVRDAQVGAVSQRSTCPPSAAVRQRSIADMTLSWPRLT